MFVRELLHEGAVQIFSRQGNKTVRKYRCTSGTRRGRIVAKPATCTKPINVKAATKLKQTRKKTGTTQKVATRRTKRANPSSRRLKGLNVGSRRLKPQRKRGRRR